MHLNIVPIHPLHPPPLTHTPPPPMQESLRVQEFFLQVDEEESWIREKEPLASSADYGRDVKGVVKLQQKHQLLEAEIQGRPFIRCLLRTFRLMQTFSSSFNCVHTKKI